MKRLIALLYITGIATFAWVVLATHSGVPGAGTAVPFQDYIAMAGLACFPLAVILTAIHVWRSNPSALAILLLFPIGLGLVMIGMTLLRPLPAAAYAGGGILAFATLLALRKVLARLRPSASAAIVVLIACLLLVGCQERIKRLDLPLGPSWSPILNSPLPG